MSRECGLCGQPIPPMSKMAKKLSGESREAVLAQLPTLSKDSRLPLREDAASGQVWIEVCMACWIHTGEANRR